MSQKNTYYINTATSELSHEQLKELYIQKMKAAERHDTHFLKTLHGKHPELFDKRFLYEMLQKELQKTGEKLSLEMDMLLKQAIDNIKIQ